MKCLQCGKELTTGDGLNLICQECEQKNKQTAIYGWTCPRCGKVNSPFVLQCDCPPPTKTWNSTTTEEI